MGQQASSSAPLPARAAPAGVPPAIRVARSAPSRGRTGAASIDPDQPPPVLFPDQRSPFTRAVRAGDTVEAARLLEHYDVDVNAADEHGEPPLHIAAYKGDAPMLTFLLGRASANTEVTDFQGRTALFRAAEHAQLATVRLLLQARANVDSRSATGLSVMQAGLRTRDKAVIRQLYISYPDVNTIAKDGCTPVHDAAGHVDCNLLDCLLRGASTRVVAVVHNGHGGGREGSSDLVAAAQALDMARRSSGCPSAQTPPSTLGARRTAVLVPALTRSMTHPHHTGEETSDDDDADEDDDQERLPTAPPADGLSAAIEAALGAGGASRPPSVSLRVMAQLPRSGLGWAPRPLSSWTWTWPQLSVAPCDIIACDSAVRLASRAARSHGETTPPPCPSAAAAPRLVSSSSTACGPPLASAAALAWRLRGGEGQPDESVAALGTMPAGGVLGLLESCAAANVDKSRRQGDASAPQLSPTSTTSVRVGRVRPPSSQFASGRGIASLAERDQTSTDAPSEDDSDARHWLQFAPLPPHSASPAPPSRDASMPGSAVCPNRTKSVAASSSGTAEGVIVMPYVRDPETSNRVMDGGEMWTWVRASTAVAGRCGECGEVRCVRFECLSRSRPGYRRAWWCPSVDAPTQEGLLPLGLANGAYVARKLPTVINLEELLTFRVNKLMEETLC